VPTEGGHDLSDVGQTPLGQDLATPVADDPLRPTGPSAVSSICRNWCRNRAPNRPRRIENPISEQLSRNRTVREVAVIA
jgi:hypothetical protein